MNFRWNRESKGYSSEYPTRNEDRLLYWVVATLPVDLLDLLREKFEEVGIVRFTAAEVEVLGQETESVDGIHAMRVEVAVNEEFLSPTLAVLDELSANGNEVNVHVGSLKDARRIRTGEAGSDAI